MQAFNFKTWAWHSFLSRARLAQPAERKALNLVVVGSSPTVGALAMGLGHVRPAAAWSTRGLGSEGSTRTTGDDYPEAGWQ